MMVPINSGLTNDNELQGMAIDPFKAFSVVSSAAYGKTDFPRKNSL